MPLRFIPNGHDELSTHQLIQCTSDLLCVWHSRHSLHPITEIKNPVCRILRIDVRTSTARWNEAGDQGGDAGIPVPSQPAEGAWLGPDQDVFQGTACLDPG